MFHFDISAFWKLKGALLGAELDEVWPCQRIVSSWGSGEWFSGSNSIWSVKVVSCIWWFWWWGAGGPVTPLLHVRAIFLCPVLMSIDLAHLGWKVGLANLCKLFKSLLSHQIGVDYWLLESSLKPDSTMTWILIQVWWLHGTLLFLWGLNPDQSFSGACTTKASLEFRFMYYICLACRAATRILIQVNPFLKQLSYAWIWM